MGNKQFLKRLILKYNASIKPESPLIRAKERVGLTEEAKRFIIK